jgi:hypothetical protein
MELDPQALEAIINKKAEEFSNEDIDKLIEHFRKERANFAITEAAGKRAPKRTAQVDPALAKLLDDI